VNPIVVTINTAVAQAAQQIREFATGATMDLKKIPAAINPDMADAIAKFRAFGDQTQGILSKIATHGHESESVFMANRMAIMELEHSARAMADGLISGINPLRMMAMEGPRLMEAGANMTEEFKSRILALLPMIGGIGVAIGAAALAWSYFGDAMVDPTKRVREMASAMERIPDLVKQISLAQKAGLLTDGQAQKYIDIISGKTPLYREQSHRDAFGGEAVTDASGVANAMFGKDVDPQTGAILRPPMLTTNAFATVNQPLPSITQQMGMVGGPGGFFPASAGSVPGTSQQIPLQPANQKERIDYAQWKLSQDGITDAMDKTKVATQAIVDLHLQEQKIQRDSLVGLDKQIAREQDRFQIERDNLAQTRKNLSAAGGLTPALDAEYNTAIATSKTNEQQSVAELRQKQAEEDAHKIADAQNKVIENGTKIAEGLRDQMEAKITANARREGVMLGQFYQSEFNQRAGLEYQFLNLGLTTEDKYNTEMDKAQAKRLEGERQYAEELKKIAELKQQIASEESKNQLAAIDRDPLLTPEQKQQASVPAWQKEVSNNETEMTGLQQTAQTSPDANQRAVAQEKYNQVLGQTQALQSQINQAQASFAQKFQQDMVQLGGQWTNLSQQINQLFTQTLSTGINSVSSNLTKVIQGTETWHKALLNIEQTILNEVIDSIIKMAIEWVIGQTIMAVAGKSIAAASTAGIAPIAAAQALAWAAPATLATIASYGGAALAAPGFIGVAEGAVVGLSAFADGGYTGAGGQYAPAGIVHRGEYVFSAAAVDRIGLPALDAMHNGGGSNSNSSGSGSAGDSKPPSVSNYIFSDKQAMVEQMMKDDATEKHVVDIMRRNIHRFR
jgi:hypothetical protein